MAEQTFMVCATRRTEDNPSLLRYFGILHLIEEAKRQTYEGDIKLAIVDCSAKPHPFFVNPEALLSEHGIAYIHTPNRDTDAAWRSRFPSSSVFVPSDDDLETDLWKMRAQNMHDWDEFVLFDEKFKNAYKGPWPSAFMRMERPTIGMKKNVGIMALAENFGAAENIIFCDDDDRHHDDYVKTIAQHLKEGDFARPHRWLTLLVGKEASENVWGIYDVPFYKDSNNNWRPPAGMLSKAFHSSLKSADGSEFVRTIGEKFSPGMCTTFPPLSHDGALHSYRFDTWQKAVDLFGGCSPTSMCEDMLFYRMCKDNIPDFNPVRVDSKEPLFIRCADGSNASLIEWNEDLPTDHAYSWAQTAAFEIQRNLHSGLDEEKVISAGKQFLKTGQIEWNKIFGKTTMPVSQKNLRPFDI